MPNISNKKRPPQLAPIDETGMDRIFRLPRVWSNRELLDLAPNFKGSVANVSGWTDIDKEGHRYRDYFCNADEYIITNFRSDARGFQGQPGEIFLDLTQPLPPELENRFDVVFNHTVLEHIYEVQTAFDNLCRLSKDVVLIVVPFLQTMHAHYGDYWRFTPLTLKKMYEARGMEMLRCTFNSHPNASVYLVATGSRQPEKWTKLRLPFNYEDPLPAHNGFENFVGCHAIQNQDYQRSRTRSGKLVNKIIKKLRRALP